MSTAMLLDEAATPSMHRDWLEMCKHALSAMGSIRIEPSEWDAKGHDIHLDARKTLAYCLKCHVSRCVRDARYVTTKPCKGAFWDCELAEGSLLLAQGHVLKVQMMTWKKAGSRPALLCLRCGLSFWSASLASLPSL